MYKSPKTELDNTDILNIITLNKIHNMKFEDIAIFLNIDYKTLNKQAGFIQAMPCMYLQKETEREKQFKKIEIENKNFII